MYVLVGRYQKTNCILCIIGSVCKWFGSCWCAFNIQNWCSWFISFSTKIFYWWTLWIGNFFLSHPKNSKDWKFMLEIMMIMFLYQLWIWKHVSPVWPLLWFKWFLQSFPSNQLDFFLGSTQSIFCCSRWRIFEISFYKTAFLFLRLNKFT